MKKIGCLHAHYSNIEYIQNALATDKLEFVHFVDPGLMSRIQADKVFDEITAKNKVIEQMEWISQASVDAILITCTNYIALLDEDRLKTSIPIIKIDEPFFDSICEITEPQVLLFTNPATVEGTMRRLHAFASAHGKPIPNTETHVIENTFELIMQGKKEQYVAEVSSYISGLITMDKNKKISVAQLSMMEPAGRVEQDLNVKVGNPLQSLVTYFDNFFK